MEDNLVDVGLRLQAALPPGELRQVVGCLGIFRGQHLKVHFVPLISRELFLVVARHIVVIDSKEVLIVLEIIIVVFFDLAAGRAFLGSSSSGRHINCLFKFKFD